MTACDAPAPAEPISPSRRKPEPLLKRSPLNMRTTPDLRKKIEKAALRSGRPLTQEVETILEKHFGKPEGVYTDDLPHVMQQYFLAVQENIASLIEKVGPPHKSVDAYQVIYGALIQAAEDLPKPKNVNWDPLLRAEEARKERDRAAQKLGNACKKVGLKGLFSVSTQEDLSGRGLAGLLQQTINENFLDLMEYLLERGELANAILKAHSFAMENDLETAESLAKLVPLAEKAKAAEAEYSDATKDMMKEIEDLREIGKHSVLSQIRSHKESI